MSVMISKPFNGDNNAEWHKLEDCKAMGDSSRLVCMVCGEDIPSHKFAFGFKVDCPDCGIYLENVQDEWLVHYTDKKNEDCAEKFYTRNWENN